MKKLAAICIAFAIVTYSTAAFSRICFLADLECQEGKFSVDKSVPCLEQNSSWTHEYDKCETIQYNSAVCNDTTGNYYEENGCISGYTDLSGDSKHECEVSLSCNKCCPDNKVKCKENFKLCTDNSAPSSDASNDSCVDSEGTKFLKCDCDTNGYPYKCTENGLTGDSENVCIGDNGTWYKKCLCSSGYYQTDLSNIKCSETCPDNCRLGNSTLLPGTVSTYCWEGAECLPDDTGGQNEMCILNYQSDFDKFWGGYDAATTCRNLTVDCNMLGYNTGRAGSGVLCQDGTEPYRCPFDHTQVYCESGIDQTCEFVTQRDCEQSYFGSTCTINATKCYLPTACKIGYAKTVSACSNGERGIWSLGSADAFGCATCQCKSTCEDTTTLIPANSSEVTEECQSCGETKTIITGFTCNAGYRKKDTRCEACNCIEPNKDNYYTEYPSDCDIYGDYEGCNSSGMVEFDQAGYDKDLATYTACLEECYPELNCSSGYALSAGSCGTSGGWKLSTTSKDSAGCFKCIAKTCNDYAQSINGPQGTGYLYPMVESDAKSFKEPLISEIGTFQLGNNSVKCVYAYDCNRDIYGGNICDDQAAIILNGVATHGCGVGSTDGNIDKSKCDVYPQNGYWVSSVTQTLNLTVSGKKFTGTCRQTGCWQDSRYGEISQQLTEDALTPAKIFLCTDLVGTGVACN